MRSLYGLPLMTQSGRPTGSMTLLLPEDETLGAADETLLVAQAEHAARALTRARRYEREHDVAIALQRSLLPELLPSIEGLDFAGRYSAGGVGLEVGGDWYDAVRRPDGLVHLTVGDVAGRGIAAAVLMGQLRNAFRALAYDHTSPAEIARRLTATSRSTAWRQPSSSPSTRTPASLRTRRPAIRRRCCSTSRPARSRGSTGERAAARLGGGEPRSARRRCTLAGERGCSPTRTGSSSGAASASTTASTGWRSCCGTRRSCRPRDAADRLLDYLVIPLSATDDIALLLVRNVGVPATWRSRCRADPTLMHGVVPALRRLARPARRRPRTSRADAVLAISEACNNAIEHGYAGRGGTIRLRFEHRAASAHVHDRGRGTSGGRRSPTRPAAAAR